MAISLTSVEALIRHHEGCREKPYRDSAGHLTIGVGYNLEAHGLPPRIIEELFVLQLGAAFRDAQSFPWFRALSKPRRAVVVDMIYNLGLPRFKTFKKAIGHLAREQYDQAAAEMLDSKWARQVGARALRLAGMMRAGEWPAHV